MALCGGKRISTIRSFVLTQYRSVADRQTDGRTDGRSISRVAFMSECGRVTAFTAMFACDRVLVGLGAPVYVSS